MKRDKNPRWRKLDNTAKLFPVMANKHRTNVYRVAVTLKEEIDPVILEQAVNQILPWFETFTVRLRKGFFWPYFEDNRRPVKVTQEDTWPCGYINPQAGDRYMFRVSYYKKRINFEVFHAITDGLGAIDFLKELIYCYLDLKNGRTFKLNGAGVPSSDCYHALEDSYVKNYKKSTAKSYSTEKAFQIKEEKLPYSVMNVMHGHLDNPGMKRVCKEKNASTTQILASMFIYVIYQEYWKNSNNDGAIMLALPVNLRNFFESETTMNFFAITHIGFQPGNEEATFDMILAEVKKQMADKIRKEKFEEMIAYNVGYEKKLTRFAPLFLKEIVTKMIYSFSEKSYTMTLSNLGKIQLLPEYESEVESFSALQGVCKSQPLKCTIVSHKDDIIVTIASFFEPTYLQKGFFRLARQLGMNVILESNGVHDEKM